MKTIISTIILAAGMTSSAMASSYYQSSQKYGSYNTYDLQPICSIEGLYAIGEGRLFDMSGARLGFNLCAMDGDFRHQFSLKLGILKGSDDLEYMNIAFKGDASLIPITLGYDVSIKLNDYIFLDMGANAGLSHGDFKATIHTPEGKFKLSDDQTAFTHSFGVGFKFIISEETYIKLGYEYSRSFFDNEVKDVFGTLDQSIISLGFGIQF